MRRFKESANIIKEDKRILREDCELGGLDEVDPARNKISEAPFAISQEEGIKNGFDPPFRFYRFTSKDDSPVRRG